MHLQIIDWEKSHIYAKRENVGGDWCITQCLAYYDVSIKNMIY